jgi:hypothetical protein
MFVTQSVRGYPVPESPEIGDQAGFILNGRQSGRRSGYENRNCAAVNAEPATLR